MAGVTDPVAVGEFRVAGGLVVEQAARAGASQRLINIARIPA